MWNNALPTLGTGIEYRDVYRTDIFRNHLQIDFLEITADHFFDPNQSMCDLLSLIADRFPVIPHGLALSLGSADGLDRTYLKKLPSMVKEVAPPWWSELDQSRETLIRKRISQTRSIRFFRFDYDFALFGQPNVSPAKRIQVWCCIRISSWFRKIRVWPIIIAHRK